MLSESAQGRNVKCFTSSGDSSIGEVVGDEAELDREQEVLVAPSEDSPASSRSSSLETTATATASKKEMLRFALPALGIYLSNPLLSNIDNAFVGRTVGTAGLAALSPATICTDQMLYLFSFLSRATTSIVSRAYALKEDGSSGNAEAAREAASARTCESIFYLQQPIDRCLLWLDRHAVDCSNIYIYCFMFMLCFFFLHIQL